MKSLPQPRRTGTVASRSAPSIRLAIVACGLFAISVLRIDVHAQERIEIGNPEELLALFEKLDYTPEAWQAGSREIPRVYLMQIGENWRINSQNLEVINKKRIFFRALAPLVLRANELILQDRERLTAIDKGAQGNPDDTAWLRTLALRYEVIDDTETELDAARMKELMARVDAVPTSLVLAQGAEESGWGTSRFAAEGNALFGQWTWGGKGIMPKQQREGMGDYRIAAYDSPLESIQAYMQNINTHPSYAELRAARAGMRVSEQSIPSGWALAEMLTRYSERGAEYVETLHTIMRVNRLQATDEAVLVGNTEYHVFGRESE